MQALKERCQALADATKYMTPRPWKVDTDFDGDNWLVGGLGEWWDEQASKWVKPAITTDRVHASEMSGDAMDDAQGIVAFRNLTPDLVQDLWDEAEWAHERIAQLVAALTAAGVPVPDEAPRRDRKAEKLAAYRAQQEADSQPREAKCAHCDETFTARDAHNLFCDGCIAEFAEGYAEEHAAHMAKLKAEGQA